MLDKSVRLAHQRSVMGSSQPFTDRVRGCAEHLAEIGAAALSELFELTSVRLVRYSTTITRNQHDAEDAVQASLVKIAGNPKLLCGAEQPWHYMLRMIRNESLVILRRKKRWTPSDGIIDLRTICAVDELDREDDYRAVWLALRTLPDEQSEVVVLKIWEELTFAQIAIMLDVSPSTAASRYRYAIDKLGKHFRRDQNEVMF